MAEALLRRRSGLVLAPADGLAEIELESFPMGRDILCTLKRSRSNPNLRHYWACLQAFSKATDKGSARVLHELLKMECGLVTPISTQSGGLKLVPDSVAFDRLDEPAFIDFKRRAFDALRINFGIDPTTLSNEGAELLGTSNTPQDNHAETAISSFGSSSAPAALPSAGGPRAGETAPTNAQATSPARSGGVK